MIDFHSHILPGIDDGSKDVDMSLKMVETLKNQGVDTICATSHFYATQRTPQRFLQRRQEAYEKLKADLPEDAPRILLGAEVLFFPGISHMEELPQLCLQGTDLLLLEMPFQHWSEGLLDSVEALTEDRRFRIVLAHVDRYDRREVEKLLRMDRVQGQVNVDSMKRLFGTRYLREWAREGRIVALGSDIHGTDVGYRDWTTCRVRYREDWETIMKRTNRLLTSLV